MISLHKSIKNRESCFILGMRVDAASYADSILRILDWAREKKSRYICAANVHMVMEAYDSADFRHIINSADLVTPDGMPLVWGLRLLGVGRQERICGPDLTLHLLEQAAKEGLPVGFYGSSPEVLDKLLVVVKKHFPLLHVPYTCSPPFRPMTREEDDRAMNEINASGVRILFVGLGCPKQEKWMAEHVKRIQTVQIGVGAAFDFIAGTKQQAPRWVREFGFEWLFRLMTEPRRLMMRYLKNNPRFLLLFAAQLIKSKWLGTIKNSPP